LGKTPKVQKLHAPVYLRVTVYKTGGNWDADNREIKSIQDSIVKSGILEDDTIEEIPKVYKEGVRVKTKAEEKTVIEVIEL
jgi:Holliday junction resolvase RusA-like endonuclease